MCVFLFQQRKKSCFTDLTFMNHVMGQEKKRMRRETTGKRKERSDPILKEMLRIGSQKNGPFFRGEGNGQKEDKNTA